MSTTTNLGLFKHDNPSTNTDAFDIDTALNENWDKIDEAMGENTESINENKSEIEYIENENSMLKGLLPKGEAEGENILIEDSGEAVFDEFKINGNTKQTTYTGKNLFDYENYTYDKTVLNAYRFIEIQDVKATTQYTLYNYDTIEGFKNVYFSTSAQYAGIIWGAGDLAGKTSASVTTSSNGILYICVYKEEWTEEDWNTFINFFKKAMFVEGTDTTSSYEPYVGGTASPNPDYPQEIKNVGDNVNLAWNGWAQDFVKRINDTTKANLITRDNRNCLYYSANAGYRERDNKYLLKINWKENTQYTLAYYAYSSEGFLNLSIVYTDDTTTSIDGTPLADWSRITLTSLANKTIKYIIVRYTDGYTYIDLDTFILAEGTTATSYSPYNCGNVNIVVGNKNLLGISDVEETTWNGLSYSISNGEIRINGTASAGGRLLLGELIVPLEYKEFGYKVLSADTSGTRTSSFNIQLRDINNTTNLTNVYENNLPLKIYSDISTARYLAFYIGSGTVFTNYKIKLQLEECLTATDYEEHQGQNFTFPLSEGQRLYEGNYLADDGVHHKRGQKIYLTSEFSDFQTYTNLSAVFIPKQTNDIKYGTVTRTKSIICDKATYSIRPNGYDDVDLIGKIYDGGTDTYMIGLPSTISTLNGARTYLGDVTLEYELAEEVIEPYTTEQQEVYNQIKKAKSYKGGTHIYSTDETSPKFEVSYFKDLEGMIDNISSAVVALGGDINV